MSNIDTQRRSKGLIGGETFESPSETTIYRTAVKKARISSSSSDEGENFNSTDEFIKQGKQGNGNGMVDMDTENEMNRNSIIDNFLCVERRRSTDRERPHCLHEVPEDREGIERQAQANADKLVREAELAKAKIYDVAGNFKTADQFPDNKELRQVNKALLHSLIIDEEYSLVGGHIDDGLRKMIEQGGYVNFSKLISKDRVDQQNDNRLEILNSNGSTYLAPFSDHFVMTISSLYKWQQAFRVYTNIYLNANPKRGSEIVQYNHVICTAAQTYPWDDVYRYDQEFRIHLGKHPERSWAVILQHAWNINLKDKLHAQNPQSRQGNNGYGSQKQNGKTKSDLCYRFNRGKCNFGFNCKFQHKCGLCNKFGHGAHNCRKASKYDNAQDKEKEFDERRSKKHED